MDISPLISLPAELRNAIYIHVFSSRFAVEFDKSPIQHPLTKVCRQIRQESLGLYYTMTRFNAHLRDGPIYPLIHWMETIGRDACLLVREIRLWDMHDNVCTILSPTAASVLLEDSSNGITRQIATELSPPHKHDAMVPQQKMQLWSAITNLRLGLRQIKEQYSGSSLLLSTSCYSLTDLCSRVAPSNEVYDRCTYSDEQCQLEDSRTLYSRHSLHSKGHTP